MLRVISEKSRCIVNHSMSGPFSRLNIHSWDTDENLTGQRCPADKAVCVYNIPCDCGRCYINKTSRHLEIYIMVRKYNLNQGLLEKINISPTCIRRRLLKYVKKK
jgi:hypothetical protein